MRMKKRSLITTARRRRVWAMVLRSKEETVGSKEEDGDGGDNLVAKERDILQGMASSAPRRMACLGINNEEEALL